MAVDYHWSLAKNLQDLLVGEELIDLQFDFLYFERHFAVVRFEAAVEWCAVDHTLEFPARHHSMQDLVAV